MVVTLLVTSSFVFKDLMARFETTDIGCRCHEKQSQNGVTLCGLNTGPRTEFVRPVIFFSINLMLCAYYSILLVIYNKHNIF